MPPEPILDTDLSSLDTSRQVLAEALVDLKLDKLELIDNDKKDGKLLKYQFLTTVPLMSVRNEQVLPPFRLFGQISIKSTAKLSKSEVERNVAEFVQSFHPKLDRGVVGRDDVWTDQLASKLSSLVGRVSRCRVIVRKERQDKETGRLYPESNEIGAFLKV